VREEVAKHVTKLRKLAELYTHYVRVYEVYREACSETASMLDHIARVEEDLDEILWGRAE